MRSSCTRGPWHRVLEEMLIELTGCWQLLGPDIKKAERAFHLGKEYWAKAKALFGEESMVDDQVEIHFFRNIKPKFVSEIGYGSLLYNALLYLPEKPEHQQEFWKREAKKFGRFREKNREFITYYETKDHSQDEVYFLRPNLYLFPPPVRMIYDVEDELYSAKDHLITACLTESRYLDYVRSRF